MFSAIVITRLILNSFCKIGLTSRGLYAAKKEVA
jgi:hypothetical protein